MVRQPSIGSNSCADEAAAAAADDDDDDDDDDGLLLIFRLRQLCASQRSNPLSGEIEKENVFDCKC